MGEYNLQGGIIFVILGIMMILYGKYRSQFKINSQTMGTITRVHTSWDSDHDNEYANLDAEFYVGEKRYNCSQRFRIYGGGISINGFGMRKRLLKVNEQEMTYEEFKQKFPIGMPIPINYSYEHPANNHFVGTGDKFSTSIFSAVGFFLIIFGSIFIASVFMA